MVGHCPVFYNLLIRRPFIAWLAQMEIGAKVPRVMVKVNQPDARLLAGGYTSRPCLSPSTASPGSSAVLHDLIDPNAGMLHDKSFVSAGGLIGRTRRPDRGFGRMSHRPGPPVLQPPHYARGPFGARPPKSTAHYLLSASSFPVSPLVGLGSFLVPPPPRFCQDDNAKQSAALYSCISNPSFSPPLLPGIWFRAVASCLCGFPLPVYLLISTVLAVGVVGLSPKVSTMLR
ncbi:hypothetical protein VTK73DRAFT_597 [Phialemonium thermophilum]|uniref:Uncharacterized protein n=1 Tax=Phialemonium thermophilum TaxID=223376 RepID=A0ABR3VUN4_9PEZI